MKARMEVKYREICNKREIPKQKINEYFSDDIECSFTIFLTKENELEQEVKRTDWFSKSELETHKKETETEMENILGEECLKIFLENNKQ